MARLIKTRFGTRIYYTLQSGYDTHSNQLRTHQELLFDLSAAVKAFLDDLAAAKLGDRVALLCFSEFGRTVKENGSEGTDHGTSGPVFLAGPGVKSGVVGKMPSLLELDSQHGDLKTVTDFRQVYASVLEDHWESPPSRCWERSLRSWCLKDSLALQGDVYGPSPQAQNPKAAPSMQLFPNSSLGTHESNPFRRTVACRLETSKRPLTASRRRVQPARHRERR